MIKVWIGLLRAVSGFLQFNSRNKLHGFRDLLRTLYAAFSSFNVPHGRHNDSPPVLLKLCLALLNGFDKLLLHILLDFFLGTDRFWNLWIFCIHKFKQLLLKP